MNSYTLKLEKGQTEQVIIKLLVEVLAAQRASMQMLTALSCQLKEGLSVHEAAGVSAAYYQKFLETTQQNMDEILMALYAELGKLDLDQEGVSTSE